VPQPGWLPVTNPIIGQPSNINNNENNSNNININQRSISTKDVVGTHKPIQFPSQQQQKQQKQLQQQKQQQQQILQQQQQILQQQQIQQQQQLQQQQQKQQQQQQQQRQQQQIIVSAKPANIYNNNNVATLFESNNQFPPAFQEENVFLKPKSQNYVPLETLSFQVETVSSEPHPIDHNHISLPSQRNERAVLKNVEVENVDVDDEDSFIERVRRLDCKQDVEKLIVDILDGPLRQRNALLVIYLPFL
jgi:hypothetical protein